MGDFGPSNSYSDNEIDLNYELMNYLNDKNSIHIPPRVILESMAR